MALINCPNCGESMSDQAEKCPKCGAPYVKEIKCLNCGADLEPGQDFCPKCGQRAGSVVENNVSAAINQFNAGVDKKNNKKKFIPIIIAVVAIIAIVLVLLLKGPAVKEIKLTEDKIDIKVDESKSVSYTISPDKASDAKVTWKSSNESVATVSSNGEIKGKGDGACTVTVTVGKKSDTVSVTVKSGPDLKKIYDEKCDSSWAKLASDGSYLSIDTNPYDINDHTEIDACYAINDVITELGLPESLIEDMGHTSSIDGKQEEEYDDVVVSWKYHPDHGLEVTFKAK